MCLRHVAIGVTSGTPPHRLIGYQNHSPHTACGKTQAPAVQQVLHSREVDNTCCSSKVVERNRGVRLTLAEDALQPDHGVAAGAREASGHPRIIPASPSAIYLRRQIPVGSPDSTRATPRHTWCSSEQRLTIGKRPDPMLRCDSTRSRRESSHPPRRSGPKVCARRVQGLCFSNAGRRRPTQVAGVACLSPGSYRVIGTVIASRFRTVPPVEKHSSCDEDLYTTCTVARR